MPASPNQPYVFHAFDVSYFSAKVRSALRYKRLWFTPEGEASARTPAGARSSPTSRAIA